MKRIIAIIRPVMRDDVISALHLVENFPGASMSEILGLRRGLKQHVDERKESLTVDFGNYIRLEIICSDSMVSTLVETIHENARTGKPGDGKIFVSPIESALRIESGETGEKAL